MRHVDEAQVRAIAAKRLDCDASVLTLESGLSHDDGVARYEIQGCGQRVEYDCSERGDVVTCQSTQSHASDTSSSQTTSDSSTNSYDSGGCDCGHAHGNHSSSPAQSPASTSVMPHTQQIDNQHR